MDLFRLRTLNTALFFLVGVGVGYLLRWGLSRPAVPAASPPAPRIYQAIEPSAASEPGADGNFSGYGQARDPAATGRAPDGGENQDDLDSIFPEKEAVPSAGGEGGGEAEIRPDSAGKSSAVPEQQPALSNAEAERFVKNPLLYKSRELTFELQMLMVRRAGDKWRLNFSFPELGTRLYYVYLDDTSKVLGDKPDLKIGYFYIVTFLCSGGDLNSGNRLISIRHMGRKADWATGMPAVEFQ